MTSGSQFLSLLTLNLLHHSNPFLLPQTPLMSQVTGRGRGHKGGSFFLCLQMIPPNLASQSPATFSKLSTIECPSILRAHVPLLLSKSTIFFPQPNMIICSSSIMPHLFSNHKPWPFLLPGAPTTHNILIVGERLSFTALFKAVEEMPTWIACKHSPCFLSRKPPLSPDGLFISLPSNHPTLMSAAGASFLTFPVLEFCWGPINCYKPKKREVFGHSEESRSWEGRESVPNNLELWKNF